MAKIENNKVLLHICCAPDATVPLEEFSREGRDIIGYFYGANIHPIEEYERRKFAVKTLLEHKKIGYILGSSEPENWLHATREFADEPEGGKRCEICFKLQLEGAARCAIETGCASLCTTLTISPHKNVVLINSLGEKIATAHGLVWLERVWRKNNGFTRSIKMAKELGLFRQDYCGCEYSTYSTIFSPKNVLTNAKICNTNMNNTTNPAAAASAFTPSTP